MIRYSVSIIMPVYNEEDYIEKCLKTIINQTYSNIEEILVVDGGSKDKTIEILNEMCKKNNKISILENPKKVQPAALNIGIKKAKGDIIIRVDAHALYKEDYVLKCVEKLNELKDLKVVNVGGPTYLLTSKDYIENCIVYLHESKFGIGVAKFRQKDYEGFVDTVWNGAFFSEMFKEIGLYNENLYRSEDNDMNNRIVEKGYKIYQSKDIISYYKPRTTISEVLKQNLENGKAIGQSIIKNPSIIRIRHLVPVIFLSSIVLFGITQSVSTISRIIEIIILSSYLIVDIYESFKIGKNNGFKYIPMMIIMFFALHVYYGIGTILGFFKGFNKSSN